MRSSFCIGLDYTSGSLLEFPVILFSCRLNRNESLSFWAK